MKLKEIFKPGDIVTDLLCKHKSIVRKINSNHIQLSRVDKPESTYAQIPRYLKSANS